jgi:uncharacterized repeat protein (TIGR03803 family)
MKLIVLLTLVVVQLVHAGSGFSSYYFQFGLPVDGAEPIGVIESGGALYGVTSVGGAVGYGIAFSLTPPALHQKGWSEQLLWSFAGGPDGASPSAPLTPGPHGSFYGVTQNGGTSNRGTVFSLNPPASPGGAWTETVLHSFAGGSDGWSPQSAILVGPAGKLYGTTFLGGTSNSGTAYSLTAPSSPGGAWTHTVLFSFNTGNGGGPMGSLAMGKSGRIYGTATIGIGNTNPACTGSPYPSCAVVYALQPPESPGGAWTQTVLYVFSGINNDSFNPSGVAMGRGEVLYGTTVTNEGTVAYSLTPPASPGGQWTEAVIYTFTNQSQGTYPNGTSAIRDDGTLIGATYAGGANNYGTVYSLTPPATPGGTWSQRVLYSSGGSVGASVDCVALGTGGIIYGATALGGTVPYGTVFSLAPRGSPNADLAATVLHNFTDGGAGLNPAGGIVENVVLNQSGGEFNGGTAAQVISGGTPIIFHSFGSGTDGANPVGRLVLSGLGLYGVTQNGGTSGFGTVFSLSLPTESGDSASESVIYNFAGGSDGGNPTTGLATESNILYGTTPNGGANGQGTVFSLTPPSSPGGVWTKTLIYSFSGGDDGANPMGELIVARDGTLYGTTYNGGAAHAGTVFSLTPPSAPGGAWTETVLHAFQGGTDGANPQGRLLVWSGAFYGTTVNGGPANSGTVFELQPRDPHRAWPETVLYAFKGGSDGANPEAGVFVGKDNPVGEDHKVLYGSTTNGGQSGDGTLFSLIPPASPGGLWTEQLIFTFGPGQSGTHPHGELAWTSVEYYGFIRGSTSSGGNYGGGTAYENVIKFK